MPAFTETVVEDGTLGVFANPGYAVLHGMAIAPGEPSGNRADTSKVVLVDRLRVALLPKLLCGEVRVKDTEESQ